jgi:hypothetical protein
MIPLGAPCKAKQTLTERGLSSMIPLGAPCKAKQTLTERGLSSMIPLGAPCKAKQTLTGFIYFPSDPFESKLSTGLQ